MSEPRTSEHYASDFLVAGEPKPRLRLDSYRAASNEKRAARSWEITLSDEAAAALVVKAI